MVGIVGTNFTIENIPWSSGLQYTEIIIAAKNRVVNFRFCTLGDSLQGQAQRQASKGNNNISRRSIVGTIGIVL